MHQVFLIAFLAGLVATVVLAALSLLGGIGHDLMHDLGIHDGTHEVDADHDSVLPGALGWAIGYLSPLSISAAALWFGAAGLILEGSPLVVPIAIAAAIVGATIIRLFMRALVGSNVAPLALTAEGAIATVNDTIRPGSIGEVVYTLEGLHRSMAARSTVMVPLPRGTDVVITHTEAGIAWVEPLDPVEPASP